MKEHDDAYYWSRTLIIMLTIAGTLAIISMVVFVLI